MEETATPVDWVCVVCVEPAQALNKKESSLSEMSGTAYQSTQRHILEDLNL